MTLTPTTSAPRDTSATGQSGIPPAIELRGLCKRFGDKSILRDIDLVVPKGTSLAIIGGSGQGKSVLIKCMMGLLVPTSGEVLYAGKKFDAGIRKSREQVMKRIGVLFQGAALFDSLTIWENIAFGLINAEGMSRPSARAVAIDKLLQVGLPETAANLYPNELSGGMQKRAGLARAICSGADVLFFDEPTTGLDPVVSGQINRLLRRVVVETGTTAITITHSITSARQICDQVAFIQDGHIAWRGETRSLGNTGVAAVDNFAMGRAAADKPVHE